MVNTITDAQANEILAGLEHPRITLEYIQSRIRQTEFINPDFAPTLTICVITLDNGFFAMGMSAPAAYQNFDPQLGRKYAQENAVRDLWGKFGFALSEKIHASKVGQALKGVEVPVEVVATPVADTPVVAPSEPVKPETAAAQAVPAEGARPVV